MPRYLSRPVPTTGDVSQVERFLRAELGDVRRSTDDIYILATIVRELYTVAGYGGIGLDAVTGLSNINATWQQLPFDVVLVPDPRGIAYDIPGDGFSFTTQGVWRVNAKVSLEFAEANQGRRLQLSLWDINGAAPIGPLFNFSVGRNTDGVNLNFNVVFDITQFIDQPLGLAVNSATDTFSSVNAIGSIFDTNHVSEYKGDLFDRSAQEAVGLWQ